jgi:mercuric ion transport protein
MKKEQLAAGGAIGASLLIASCCFAPAMFLIFGVSAGALGALSALEPYRPLFITAGGLALLYAGFRIFRAVPASEGGDCDDDACTPDGNARRRTRRLFAVAVTLFAVAIAYPHVIAALL